MRAIACGVVIGALVGGTILPHPSHAQGTPDVARAKDLYRSAEAAVKDGRFAEAAGDYGAAYEITRDPVLFFKIGSANERAGKCDLALIYYGRYLREAHPSEAYVTLTRQRIVACGGDPDAAPATGGGAGSDAGSAGGTTAGSAGGTTAGGSGGHTAGSAGGTTAGSVGGAGGITSGSAGGTTAGSASGTTAGSTEGSAAAGSGATAAPIRLGAANRGAWILVASSIALVTVGGVLAYAASSSENDISDLYVGFAGQPPAFDARTQKQYDQLVEEGNRYEKLSWLAFGLAGASAISAAVLFYRSSGESSVVVAPAVTPSSAGASALIRW